MKKLFLDDVRNPIDCILYIKDKIYIEDWDIVRNYNEFVDYITENGIPDLISFDHDLADEHYHPSMFSDDKSMYNDRQSQFKEKTGYDCAKWLCDYCSENGLPLPTYLVHSMNPVGRDNILGVFNSFKKNIEKVI
jgi:rubrerythrin